eukprot:scaffold26179_cov133-Isochrysis_galbana.AAC.1
MEKTADATYCVGPSHFYPLSHPRLHINNQNSPRSTTWHMTSEPSILIYTHMVHGGAAHDNDEMKPHHR